MKILTIIREGKIRALLGTSLSLTFRSLFCRSSPEKTANDEQMTNVQNDTARPGRRESVPTHFNKPQNAYPTKKINTGLFLHMFKNIHSHQAFKAFHT